MSTFHYTHPCLVFNEPYCWTRWDSFANLTTRHNTLAASVLRALQFSPNFSTFLNQHNTSVHFFLSFFFPPVPWLLLCAISLIGATVLYVHRNDNTYHLQVLNNNIPIAIVLHINDKWHVMPYWTTQDSE